MRTHLDIIYDEEHILLMDYYIMCSFDNSIHAR